MDHSDRGIVALKAAGLEEILVVVVRGQQTVLRREIHRRQHGAVLSAGPQTLRGRAVFRRLHARAALRRLSRQIIFLFYFREWRHRF